MLNPITLQQFIAMNLDNFNTYDRDVPPSDKEDEDEYDNSDADYEAARDDKEFDESEN